MTGEVDFRPGRLCPSCYARHRTWHAVGQCRFRKGLCWLSGSPPSLGPCFALVSYCCSPWQRRPTNTVTLWETRQAAEEAKAEIDRLGCGGRCHGAHQIYTMGTEPGKEE